MSSLYKIHSLITPKIAIVTFDKSQYLSCSVLWKLLQIQCHIKAILSLPRSSCKEHLSLVSSRTQHRDTFSWNMRNKQRWLSEGPDIRSCSICLQYVDVDRRRTEHYLDSDSCFLLFLSLSNLCVPVIKAMICLDFRNGTALLIFLHSQHVFPYGRDELGRLMTMGNERQGNSVWLGRQWAIGALQSSINSMCTAICSQCLCPNIAALTLQTCIVMSGDQISRFLTFEEFFQTTILMFDKIACVCEHTCADAMGKLRVGSVFMCFSIN